MAPPRTYKVLTGPTASGKTDWLLRRARETPLAVVSADSRQVYCHMDIGTGKVSASDAKTVPHFCLDLLNSLKKFSVYQYIFAVNAAFGQLEEWKGEVWLSGGTGFFIRAVIEGLKLGTEPLPERERIRTLEIIQERGASTVSDDLDLTVVDSANARRVLRAVEAALADEERSSAVRKYFALELALQPGQPESPHGTLGWWWPAEIAVLDPGYDVLAERIEGRVRSMFAAGLLEETQRLIDLGYGEAEVIRTGIGYAESVAVLAGEMNQAAAIEQTIVRTRQYAKRQRTYFRGRGWPFYTEPELPFD